MCWGGAWGLTAPGAPLEGRAVAPHPLVDLGLVADVLGPVGVVEGVEGLLQALDGRGDGGDDAGLGAASEGLAQQPGQLRVSVGHVALLLHCGVDRAGNTLMPCAAMSRPDIAPDRALPAAALTASLCTERRQAAVM